MGFRMGWETEVDLAPWADVGHWNDPDMLEIGSSGKQGELETWMRPFGGGAMAIAILNLGTGDASITTRWEEVGIPAVHTVCDLWGRRDLPQGSAGYSATLKAHGTVLILLQTQR